MSAHGSFPIKVPISENHDINLQYNRGVGRHQDGLETLLTEKAQKNFASKWGPLIGQLEAGALGQRYNGWRRIKGDGNCFYRSVVYGALEKPGRVRDHAIYRLKGVTQSELDSVTGPTGLNEMGLDITPASREDMVTWLNGIRKTDVDTEPRYKLDIDLALVRAARALTARSMIAAYRDNDVVCPAMGYDSVFDYCKKEVLRMDHYGELEASFLPKALQIAVRIVKVDPKADGGNGGGFAQPLMATQHGEEFRQAGDRIVNVILMDGHYSVIYEADKHAAQPIAQPIQPVAQPIAQPAQGKRWACATCTYNENHDLASECAMCHYPRVAIQPDWLGEAPAADEWILRQIEAQEVEEKRLAEEKRVAEEKRIADQKRIEAARLAEIARQLAKDAAFAARVNGLSDDAFARVLSY